MQREKQLVPSTHMSFRWPKKHDLNHLLVRQQREGFLFTLPPDWHCDGPRCLLLHSGVRVWKTVIAKGEVA
jgi:hypothetical protein